jgi:PAS domain S-box-containing protein
MKPEPQNILPSEILELTENLIWKLDTDCQFIFLNKQTENTLGYSQSELLGHKISDFQPEETAQTDADVFKELSSGKIIRNHETIFKHKSGLLVHIRINAKLHNDKQSDIPPGILVTANNISEYKLTKEECQLVNSRMQNFINILEYKVSTITDFLDFALNEALKLTKSEIGYIYFYNESTKEFTLNSWSRSVMKECKIVNPEKKYLLDNTGIWGEAVRQRKTIIINDFDAPSNLKKGYPQGHVHLNNFLTIPIFYKDKIVGVVGVANKKSNYSESDSTQLNLLIETVWKITEQKKAEIALRDSEEMFRSLYENITEGVALHEIIKDDDGKPVDYRIIGVNPAYQAHTGIIPENTIGKLGTVLYGTKKPPYFEEFETVARTRIPFRFETYFPPLDKFFIISVISHRKGEFATVFEDITERKKRENELKIKNEELERFIYTVSHDLKSPLVTIKAFSSYLHEDIKSNDAETITKDIKYIQNAADKMGRLLDELLELSRIGKKDKPSQEIPIQNITNSVIDLLAGRISKTNVKIDVTSEPIILYGNLDRLMQLYQNLIDNSIKFMGNQPSPRIEIGANKINDTLQLFVKDNGSGIDVRYQHKLFGLFEKLDAHTEGTGIGLAIVKRIIQIHNGTISIHSEGIGKGTTVLFTLPNTHIAS